MMTEIFAGVSMPQLIMIIQTLGIPGLVIVIWWVEHKKQIKMQDDYRRTISEILREYKQDVNQVTRYYENNVDLVERYEKLADELSGIIHLNTQVQTHLVDSIKNNTFCPAVRKAGPGGV